MAAPMDSDDEDSFVSLGTPLEVFEDDEARKKPVSVHDLPVKDSRGRQRFHGAFTGGFSAGFFNTVGSKQGFQPASFVSSRSSKEGKVQQRPEDFMDDEDFSEHGIAPRKVATSTTYTSEERGQKRKAIATAVAGSSVIPGAAAALTDLIVPESLPVGVRLLRKMGWKEGQGIGPRERRKKKTKAKTKQEKRIIGCSLPPSDDSDEESDDATLKDITFAPKDKNPVSLKAKDNVHGLGYRGLDPKSALPSSHINLFQPPPVKGKGQKGIRGHAFGVGALEDEDDDIYTVDHLSNYDVTMGPDDQDNKFGWTAPGQNRKGKQQVPISYVGKLLEGFQLSSKPLKPKKVFKPPVLPATFRPIHRFLKPCDSLTPTTEKEKHNAVSRGVVLGETPIFKSVFDLIPKVDQKKVEKAKEPLGQHPVPVLQPSSYQQGKSRFSAPAPEPVNESASIETDRQTQLPSLQLATPGETSSAQSKPLFQGALSFQPFARDPAKQKRYDKYLSLYKQGNKDPCEEVCEGHMTEWEREREKEEFVRAAKLYKPLSAMMATRFTTAKYADDQDKVDVPAQSEGEKSDQAKAAEMKMFGKLTRDEYDWYPDKLLCRRFNVPHPYPGSTIVGLPTVKRDKYSVFNFLEFPGNQTPNSQSPGHEPPPAIEYPGKEDPSSQEVVTSAPMAKNQGMKSFSISNKSGPKPALGSIFSVLYEDDEKQKKFKQSHMEDEKITDSMIDQKAQSTPGDDKITRETPVEEGDAPTLDLFRAIFKNSDSEDTSSEDEDKKGEETSVAMDVEVTDVGETSIADVKLKDVDKPLGKGDVDSSIQYLPGAPVAMETLTQRLTPPVPDKEKSDDEMAYGPALPPPSTSGVSSTPASSPVIDLTSSEHLKNKHKYKDKNSRKNKHKKEKKAKYKKSKHKKKERKKKKVRQRKSSSDNEDSDNSDSESDSRQPSDRELRDRLKSVGGGRLKAADFM